jgi:peroxiredoxin
MMVLQLCAILLLGSFAFAEKKSAVEMANAKSLSLVGKPAPGFSLPDLNQQTFNLADRRGQVVLLAFWATWCPPCRSEMPTLAKLQRELAPEGVAVIPVAFDELTKARGFLANKNVDLWFLMDEGGSVAALYGARALPKTFLINGNGLVVGALIGKPSEAELRNAVQAARR